MIRPAGRLIALLLAMAPIAAAAQAPARLAGPPAPRAAMPLEFVAWELRPDGRAAAYVLEEAVEPSGMMAVHDFASGRLTRLPGWSTPQARNLVPAWSPDGTRLAYFAIADGVWRLHVWQAGTAAAQVFAQRAPCVRSNRGRCYQNRILWSRDGRTIYFLAEPEGQAAPAAAQPEPGGPAAPARAPEPAWRRALFADPGHGGITVLESRRIEAAPQGPVFRPGGTPADVVAADLATGQVASVLAGENVISLHLAPDGTRLLAISDIGRDLDVRQDYRDFMVLRLGRSGRPSGPAMRLHRVMQPNRGPVAWSPDSRTIAYVEIGARADGDIHLYDTDTGTTTNLSAGAALAEAGALPFQRDAASRNRETPGEKFNESTGLAWSSAGDRVYAVRRARFAGGWRTRLWSISRAGEATNVSAGAAFDARLPLPGPAPDGSATLIVPVDAETGEGGFAALAPGADRLGPPTWFDGEFRPAVGGTFSQARTGALLFVGESPRRPAESFLFRPGAGVSAALTAINADRIDPDLPAIHRVAWEIRPGEPRFGYLYVPRAAGPRPPVVVQVYPREPYAPPRSGLTYLGRPDLYYAPTQALLGLGYAVFMPDLPVAGGGATCDEIGLTLDRALDAIAASTLADSRRAAILGISFGGWTVNCAITRTNRFRAAVSVAGSWANLFSMRFSLSPGSASGGIGGGQIRVGGDAWQASDLFWRESPVAGAPNVTTPLLLVHGKLDETAPVSQSAEIYSALSGLGREVTLVTYDDADHGSVLTHADYEPRVIGWIRRHLGEPQAPSSQR